MSTDHILVRINKARMLLGEATSFQQTRKVRNIAAAISAYGKHVEASLETINRANELKINAERLIGEMLAKTPDAKTGPKELGSHSEPNSTPTLEEIGISKKLSMISQQLASVSLQQFEEAIEAQKAEGVEITTTGTLNRITPKPKRKMKQEPTIIDVVAEEVGQPQHDPVTTTTATITKVSPKPIKVVYDEANDHWMRSKIFLDKILPSDISRERVLKEVAQYVQRRLETGK
jgi:hypothetical protein